MTKVLVIDDSTMVRQLVASTLAAAGFTPLEAEDGLNALEQVREHADVALAICDVNMPRMGGLEFLAQVRVAAPAMPVIMLTTEGQTSLMQQAKSLGAKGWVVKPFRPEILVSAARKLTAQAP
jgi:two-component system chemotaxis response regulator CheY